MTASIKLRPAVGVAVMVWRDDKLLLGQRMHKDGADTWQFPGGHLEAGESVIECAARELFEETGLESERLSLAGFANEIAAIGARHYVTLFVNAECQSGDPAVMEPEKCRSWQWFNHENLPTPLFLPIINLLKQVSGLADLRAGQDIRAAGHK